jgi:hypothetical protein
MPTGTFFSGPDQECAKESIKELAEINRLVRLSLYRMARSIHPKWSFIPSGSNCAFCGQKINVNTLLAKEDAKVFHYHCALLKGLKKINLVVP